MAVFHGLYIDGGFTLPFYKVCVTFYLWNSYHSNKNTIKGNIFLSIATSGIAYFTGGYGEC